MANFGPLDAAPFVNGGPWTAVHAQLASDNLQKTANFQDGSSHAPTNPVIVAGDGMTFEGTSTDLLRIDPANDIITFDGPVDFNDSLGGAAIIGFNDTCEVEFRDASLLSMGGGTTATFQTGSLCTFVTGSNLEMQAGSIADLDADEVNFTGALVDFNQAATIFRATCDPVIESGCLFKFESGAVLTCELGSDVNIEGDLLVSSTGIVLIDDGATLSFAGGSIVTNATRVVTTATGHVPKREFTLAASGNRTLDITADVFFYEQSGANRTHTLALTTPVGDLPDEGDEIHANVVLSVGTELTYINEGSVDEICRLIGQANLQHFWIDFIHDGAKWRHNRSGAALSTVIAPLADW